MPLDRSRLPAPPAGAAVQITADTDGLTLSGPCVFLARYALEHRALPRRAAWARKLASRGFAQAFVVAVMLTSLSLLLTFSSHFRVVAAVALRGIESEVLSILTLGGLGAWGYCFVVFFHKTPRILDPSTPADGESIGGWQLRITRGRWSATSAVSGQSMSVDCSTSQIFGICSSSEGGVAVELRETYDGASRMVALTGPLSPETADWLRVFLAGLLREDSHPECA